MLLAPALVLGQAPTITGVVPQANARASAATAPLTVSFSQPLSAGAAGALKVYSAQRGGLRSRGATPAVVNGTTVSFAPGNYPFRPGETVAYTITTAAAASGGILGSPWVGQFTAAVGGTGRGGFRPSANAELTVGSSPGAVALGDLDGDGNLDLLAANLNSNTVSLRFNNGSGNFLARPTRPDLAVSSGPAALALGDIDGDGDLDLVVAAIFYGASALGSSVDVRLNDGTGLLVAPAVGSPILVGYYASDIALGDADGDGDLDIFTASGPGKVSVRFNDGRGYFSAGNFDPTFSFPVFRLTLGDVDGDHDLDFVTLNTSANTVFISYNDGRGQYVSTGGPGVAAQPSGVALGDVDGDDDLDIITTSFANGTASVRLNNGRGVFTAPPGRPDPSAGPNPQAPTMGDVDHDGDLDLVVTNNNPAGTVSVLLNDGAGNFALAGTTAVGNAPAGAFLGDVDWDGDLDVAVPNYGGTTVSIRLNQTTATPTRSSRSFEATTMLYPNPARGSFTLTLPPVAGATTATTTLLNALGQTISTRTLALAPGGTTAAYATAGLAPGLYTLRVQAGGEATALRVVVP